MRLVPWLVSVSCVAMLSPASSVRAQGRVIHGIVVDSAGAPVSYANVIAWGSQRRLSAERMGSSDFPWTVPQSARSSFAASDITRSRSTLIPGRIQRFEW